MNTAQLLSTLLSLARCIYIYIGEAIELLKLKNVSMWRSFETGWFGLCARGTSGWRGGGWLVEGKGKDKKQRDVFVPHELLSAKTTFPLFVTVSPLSLSTTRSPLSFGILHHAKLYTTAAFRGKYFENFLLPKSSWFRLTNFLVSLSCFFPLFPLSRGDLLFVYRDR